MQADTESMIFPQPNNDFRFIFALGDSEICKDKDVEFYTSWCCVYWVIPFTRWRISCRLILNLQWYWNWRRFIGNVTKDDTDGLIRVILRIIEGDARVCKTDIYYTGWY